MEEAAPTTEPITGKKRPRADDPLPLLPPGWIEAKDPRYNDTKYWYHADTKQTSWSRPTEPPDGTGKPLLSVDLPSTDEASSPLPPLPLPRTPLTAPPPPPASGAAPERKRDSKSLDGTPGAAPPAPPPGEMDQTQGGGTGRAGPENFAVSAWQCKCGWYNRNHGNRVICGGVRPPCSAAFGLPPQRRFGCGGQRSRCEVAVVTPQATISMEEATRQIAAAGYTVGGSGESGGRSNRGDRGAPTGEERAREKRERERAERRTREEVLLKRAARFSRADAPSVSPASAAALCPVAAVHASLSLEGAMVRLTVRVDTAWRALPSPPLRPLPSPVGEPTSQRVVSGTVGGSVKAFFIERGFGFIAMDGGEDHFVHAGELLDGNALAIGARVTFVSSVTCFARPTAKQVTGAYFDPNRSDGADTSAARHRVAMGGALVENGSHGDRGAPTGEERAREKRERAEQRTREEVLLKHADAPNVSPAAAAALCPAAAIRASLILEGAMVRLTVRVDAAWRALPSLPLRPLALPFGAEAAVRRPPRLALCGVSSAARKLCRNWADKGSCAYGEQCIFAHGDAELLRVRSSELRINEPPGHSTEALPQHPSPAPPAPSVAQQRRDQNWGKMKFIDERADAQHPPAAFSGSNAATAAAAAAYAYHRPTLDAAAAAATAKPAAASAPRSWGRGRGRSRSHSRERSRSRSRSASAERRRSDRGQGVRARGLELARSKKDVTGRLDLLPAQVSLILGFGGTTIAALKRAAGVTSARVQNKDSARPYVIMTGPSRDVVALAEKIVRALLRAASGRATALLLVHWATVPAVGQ